MTDSLVESETVPAHNKSIDTMDNFVADEMTSELADETQMSAQSLTGSDDDTQSENVETEASITSVTELSNAEESNYAETENVTKTKRNKFSGLPDFGGKSDWYKHKCFKRYWDHYNYVMSWCTKHYQMYNKLKEKQRQNYQRKEIQRHQRTFYSEYPWHYGDYAYHPYFHGSPCQSDLPQSQGWSGVKVSKTARSRRSREKKIDSSMMEEDTEHTDKQSGVSGSDAFEMEITEDMIEFFSKSQAHRKQRDEKKKEDKEREKEEPELVNLEDVQASPQRERTVEAPKERPGSRRTSEMKQLYGKGAAMIHGMETAIQMTFDRNKDLKQPKLWPNMPLRIVFN